MKHFDITEWADFVLSTATGAKREEMVAHLTGGCPDCAHLRDLLQQVREMTAADALFEPPEDLVKAVNAIASAPPHRPLLHRLLPTMVFDSFADLQPEGARGGRPSSRQLAFVAGSYRLELQMESSHSQVTLVGQFRQDEGAARVDGLPVMLLSGGHTIAKALTNDFGEFCLEYRDRASLRLCIPLEDRGTQIEVPLSQVEP